MSVSSVEGRHPIISWTERRNSYKFRRMTKPTTNSKYTADELEHHLGYEVLTLTETYEILGKINGLLNSGATAVHKEVLHNSLIESFCVHARALVEFFCKSGTNCATTFANNYPRAKEHQNSSGNSATRSLILRTDGHQMPGRRSTIMIAISC
jgi:hypothetical protein